MHYVPYYCIFTINIMATVYYIPITAQYISQNLHNLKHKTFKKQYTYWFAIINEAYLQVIHLD